MSKLSFLLCLLVLLSGTSRAQPTPAEGDKPSAEANEPPKPGAEDYTLENSLNIRDPFRRAMPRASLAQDDNGNDLEKYEIDKFKLVGVITGPKRHKALLTTPSGKMHVVSESMRIGNRRGVIKKIAPGTITVEEKLVNILGQEEVIETNIDFKSGEKGI